MKKEASKNLQSLQLSDKVTENFSLMLYYQNIQFIVDMLYIFMYKVVSTCRWKDRR